MLLNRLIRPAQRTAQVLRRNMSGSMQEEERSCKTWMYTTALVAIPGVALCVVNAFFTDPEDHSPPEFIQYEHLRVRRKAFPWGNGDRSMLHNPQTNATSEGFEEEYVAHH
ncbi:Cytochrome c oxidase subunit 6A1 [Mactra antiquata]